MVFLMNGDHKCQDFRNEVVEHSRSDKLCAKLFSQGLLPFKNSLLSAGIMTHK